MPSRDRINAKANEWMAREPSAPGKPPVSAPGVRPEMSASVQRLARRLGSDPHDLAAGIPADTLRRTRYPTTEAVLPDGARVFNHDLGFEA